MSDLRLRARSVTEIVDAAFQLYKRDALEYVLVTGVAYAPLIVAQLVFLRGLTFANAQMLAGISPVTSIALIVISVLAYALMSAALSRFSSDVYLERPTGLGQVIRDVLPLVPRLIGATIVFGLVIMLGFLAIMVGAIVGSLPVIFLGVLLSIFWAFYAIARFFAVSQLIVLENLGIVAAFTRSGMLSQNRKGHILLTLFLVFVIFIMLSFAVTMVAQVVGSIAASVVLQTLYTVVAYPLIGITQMILYYDARIRAEGFDIEVMTGALDTPQATV
jgi:hypothetical protein